MRPAPDGRALCENIPKNLFSMDQKVNIKIKNSIVIVGENGPTEKLVKQFDLADATPVDCMHFLARLKRILTKKR